MADDQGTLRRIEWQETFPFLRLFSTFGRVANMWVLTLGFACLLLTFIAGWMMDRMWMESDAGVIMAGQSAGDTRRLRGGGPVGLGVRDEIEAYATLDDEAFNAWLEKYKKQLNSLRMAAEDSKTAVTDEMIAEKLEALNARLQAELERLEKNTEISAEDRDTRRQDLVKAADRLRFRLAGFELEGSRGARRDNEDTEALNLIFAADVSRETQEVGSEPRQFSDFLEKLRIKTDYGRITPQGPFFQLLDYEMKCFSGAIQGVCAGRIGFSGSALSAEPAMLGSIVSAGSGAFWLATQRPCYFVIFALVLTVIHSLFGGAICRVTAVRLAREEGLSAPAALRFAREKFWSFAAALLLPVCGFVVIGILIWIGGLIGSVLGLHVIIGLGYILTLIGGFLLAMLLILLVTGFHLMWPTIASEGSDAFDGIQRAFGYVMQRPWHTAFYSIVLLIYGAFSFVFVRLLAMLSLKLSHVFTGAGMNLASSEKIETLGKLDAIWIMPAWQDLPLLPSTGDVAFWGSLNNAPLSGAESFTWFVLALWLFVFVGLVGAFVLGFYYCGSTQMYFLLRREVDGVDFEEIYYEEPEDEFGDELDQPPAPLGGEAKPADDADKPE